MKFNDWIDNFKEQFEKKELHTCEVHKVKIQLQLKNPITNEIELHDMQYTSKDAINLEI